MKPKMGDTMSGPEALIGQTISHYRVLEKLGEGGMGEVYLAHDLALDRTVALKFLLPNKQADQTARRRLLAEARSAAALDHPFICKVYEASEADDLPFIAMEYVEGSSLKDRLLNGAFPLKETLRIATEISEALECAHGRGIVHRDLKPSNILLSGDGHVKVLDFGLATHLATGSLGTEKTATTMLTHAGATPGTLAFMSPEQLNGEPADTRSDIFAFGLILYEMITGAHPFLRDSPLKTACAILDDAPPPITRKGEELPDLMHRTIQKMLAKNPDQRFQSIREVRTNLTEMLHQQRPPVPTFVSALRMTRPIWLAVLILAIVFGLAGTSYWVFVDYFRSPKAALAFQKRDWIVIADFENLTGDPIFDQSLQTALVVGIQQSQYVNVLPPARVQEALGRMRKNAGVRLDEALASEMALREGAKAVLACSIADVGGVYLLTARLVEPRSRATVLTETVKANGKNQVLQALDSLAKSVRQKLGESLNGIKEQGLPLPQATTASLQALMIFAQGERLAAINSEAAVKLIEQAVVIDPDFAAAHTYLGVYYYMSGAPPRGEAHFVKALSLLDRLTLREKLWIRALVEDWRGNRETAVEYYQAYLAQYPDDSRAWFRVGWAYMAALNQPEKAIVAFENVLKINPYDSGSYINLATCYKGEGNKEKALENYQKAFQISPSQITQPFVNQEYGALLLDMGNSVQAAETFQKMLSEEKDTKKALGHRYLGMLAMYGGKYSQGITELKKAVLLHKAAGSLESEYRDHVFLASAYRIKGLDADYLAELETARGILAKAHFGPTWVVHLAKAYARLGKTRAAEKLLNDMISQTQNPAALSGVNRSGASDRAYISIVKGELALATGKPSEAIEDFELADKLDATTRAAESLAFAFRASGKPQDAARVYEDALNQRKFLLLTEGQEYFILAHYQLGKIYRELGNTAKSKEYYEKFFNIWKDADPDIPILKQAKAEYARLQ